MLPLFVIDQVRIGKTAVQSARRLWALKSLPKLRSWLLSAYQQPCQLPLFGRMDTGNNLTGTHCPEMSAPLGTSYAQGICRLRPPNLTAWDPDTSQP